MPATNLPGGVASYGIPVTGPGSVYDVPCGKLWFVCNATGTVNGDGTALNKPMSSLADALARAGTYDTIYLLAGHAENITASNVFSGTASGGPNTGAQVVPTCCRIIGLGVGPSRPTLTFTAAASTLALANAGSSIENCVLLCPQTGTTTTAAMVTVTAAGCIVRGNRFNLASSATALATTGVSLSSAASDCYITDNTADTTTGTPTSWISTTGTTGPNRVSVQRNTGMLLLSAATAGVVDVSANSSTAGVDWVVTDNNIGNKTASSTVVIKGVASWGALIAYNNLYALTTTNLATTTVNTPGNAVSFQNYVAASAKWGIVGGNAAAQTS